MALKLVDHLTTLTPNTNILLVFDDIMLHQFIEKKVFDLAS